MEPTSQIGIPCLVDGIGVERGAGVEMGAEVETRIQGNIQVIMGLRILRSVLALKQPLSTGHTFRVPSVPPCSRNVDTQ